MVAEGHGQERWSPSYYYNSSEPIFLLSVYTKAEKADLLAHEKTAMRRIVAAIKSAMKAHHKES